MQQDCALHVAVGVIRDDRDKVLITRRHRHVHQGGLWEFPGGKLEPGEGVFQALARELREEIGIQVLSASPLIKIRHDYGDRLVLLDVWNVTAYSGSVAPLEGQDMLWLAPERLAELPFPAANLPIIKAVQLPEYYAILEGTSVDEVMRNCGLILRGDIRLLQLRVKSLPTHDVPRVVGPVFEACRERGVPLLINSDLPVDSGHADGIHLSARALLTCARKPAGSGWVAASCHNLAELRHAESLGVDFAVLAPVQETASHPGQLPLGWRGFSSLVERVNLPIYALGGLCKNNLEIAREAGAQGIAGISAFLV